MESMPSDQRSSLSEGCTCTYALQTSLESIRNKLLFCPCVARISRVDADGMLRMHLLRYILRIHIAHVGVALDCKTSIKVTDML